MDTVSSYSAERSRVEIHAGDDLVAFVDLRPGGDSTIIDHTEVLPGNEGQGLGKVAVRAAIDHIEGEGRSVIATCDFARSVIGRDPELAGRVTL